MIVSCRCTETEYNKKSCAQNFKMVSTRGPKPKFDIGERVLCYEPDPKKIKMLYDAKILDLRPSQKVFESSVVILYVIAWACVFS